MKRRYFACLAIILHIFLAGCNLPSLFRRSKPAVDMRITDSREISLANASIMDRSPDGQWLIVYTYPNPPDSEFCIYRSKNLSAVFCMPETDELGVKLIPVSWSPDSSKLALVEVFPNVPIDTDIWVLNIKNANLENITQDGVSGILTADMENTPLLDNAPTWSPDSIWIAFSRTIYNEESLKYETLLYKVPALGGEAEKIQKISDEPISIQNGMLAWLDDDRLIYTPREESLSGRPLGLTAVSLSGDQPPQVLEELAGNVINSNLMSVSPDSKHALILHEIQMDGTDTYAVIMVHNMRTGESTPLKEIEAHRTPTWFARSNWAAFAPDSSKIAYVYESITPTLQWRLAIVDIGRTEEVVLKTFDARKNYVNYPLRWGEDDVLMVRLVEEKPPYPIQLLTVK